MAWLIILLLCAGNSNARYLDYIHKNSPHLEDTVFSLLVRLQLEEFFDTLLLYGEDCVFHSSSRRLNVSTVLVSSGSSNFDWNFSSLTLILSCSHEEENETNYHTLAKLQRNRRLVYLRGDIQPQSVCERYLQKEQYNVATIAEDFDKSKIVYACRHFKDPNIEEISLLDSTPVFIEQFRNMYGKPIRAVADLLSPRSMLYMDPKTGDMKITGYVANLVNTFAERVNATLELDVLAKKFIVKQIFNMIDNEQLDIGISLESSFRMKFIEISSYPYILTSYCLMVQVPAKLPYNLVYAMIIDPIVLGIIFVVFLLLSILLIYSQKMSWQDLSLANILLNDKSLRGLLGQSFPFPLNASKKLRLIITILCFASIMLTTMYEAYLQSFFTNPPSEPEICSFQDVGSYNRRIAMSALEVNGLIKTNNSHFREIRMDDLEIFDNMPECYELRDAFNLSYNYVVTGDRWRSYAEQQTLFKEPVFYFARDLCFSRLIFLSVPLRRHLPYRHLFDEHMMQQHEFGFVNYWMSHSFFDMVRLGLTSLKDLSRPLAYTPSLLMDDISWIMKIYLAAIVLCVFCFLLEIGVDKWKRWMKFRNLQILNTC
uniref:IR52e n=1 Tax=Drosophila melanogaster TaxID=7227 RepID=A0A077D7S0_DROME|nr:IR52e [Drosophila melanogaster]